MSVGRFKHAGGTVARRRCAGSLGMVLHCADVSNIELFCALWKKATRKASDFTCLTAVRPVPNTIAINIVRNLKTPRLLLPSPALLQEVVRITHR